MFQTIFWLFIKCWIQQHCWNCVQHQLRTLQSKAELVQKDFIVLYPAKDPCGGETYISPRGASFDVTWDWFPCHRTQKCIHFRNRCDLHPHPECIFENDQGETVGEDEEGCQKEDYQSNALMEQSAIFPCQSETHNWNASAIWSTVYDWTSKLSDRKFRIINSDDSYLNDVIVIMKGTIVNILSTRSQCLK